jgi:outer membrane protein assembly factor BamA
MLVWIMGLWLGWAAPGVGHDSLVHNAENPANEILRVGRVVIVGNTITRSRIIERELTLQTGDTIRLKNLPAILQLDRNKIYNLRLFNTVECKYLEYDPGMVDLIVEVSERWYTFPVPIFELSDRNVNEWIQNYNADFRRVNYGLRLYQYNFRGRNETLRLTAQFGFIRKYELQYRIPNLDATQRHGLNFRFDYGEPKNLAYFTKDHKLDFLSQRSTLRKTLGFNTAYTFRKSFYETHGLELEFRRSEVADTVVELNPNFYGNDSPRQQFFSLSYTFNSDHRDVIAYPLKGYQFTAYVNKSGLGLPNENVNIFEANLTYAQHYDLKKGWFFSNFTSGYISSPSSQPYSMFGALGYRAQLIRGYEIFVIEGPSFALNKTTLKKRIFSRVWHFEDMPVKQFRHFPLDIYLKTYTDIGYVRNYPFYEERGLNTRLSDKFLAGAGLGLDVVTFYDTVFRFEYTFTREGTRGFFFNLRKEF